MAREPHVRLTDEGIARLRPREKEYTVWDSRVAGLGVRVRPTGGKSYVLLRKTGNVLRRISLGPTMLKSVAEIRREFGKPEAREKPVRKVSPRHSVPVLRDFVAGPWTGAHFNRYKPSTRRACGSSSTAASCPPSDRSASTASPRPRSGAGSTATAGPRRAMPITASPFSARS